MTQNSAIVEDASTFNQQHHAKNLAPHIALLLVQLMFGTFAIVGKIALRTLPSTGLVALRTGGAAAALWLILWLMKRSPNGMSARISRRDILPLFCYSLLGVVLNQFLFIKGLSLSTAINATLLGSAIPIWTLAISFLIGRERVSFRKIVGCLIAAAGVVYLVNPFAARFDGSSLYGDLLLVLNTICYGAYLALSQNMIKRYGALPVITWLFTLACFATLPIGGYHLAHTNLAATSVETWLAVGYIIFLPSVAAYYLNAWALERVVPSTVAAYVYLQPIIAFALAPLMLGERLGSRIWIATALIFVGVAIVIHRWRVKSI